ncbi:hypothetical protein WJX72_009385 [[Myrmecia] bisecta]|uniref:Nucleosome assembly protein n=1 Tax=[Myrmecia] bisecta TaxID=41462 RepID=A0AAW1PDY3_9CHLO
MEDTLRTLETLQEEYAKATKELDKRWQGLLKQHATTLEPLLSRRHKLITGKAEPVPEELEGFVAPPEPELLPKAQGKGIPYFWLTVLSNQATVAEHVTQRDERALEHLEDVRVAKGMHGPVLELHFGANPYFQNRVLKRGIYAKSEGGDVLAGLREEATQVKWNPGMNLTVKETSKKAGGKKGKKKGGQQESESGQPQKKYKACSSFFRFFTPVHKPAAGHGYESSEDEHAGPSAADQRAASTADWHLELFKALVHSVAEDAAKLYTAGPLKVAHSDDDKDEEFEMGMPVLPLFWRKALKACAVSGTAVHRRDDEALTYLADVRCRHERGEPGAPSGDKLTVEFEFLPNPFFSNSVLTRTWTYEPKSPLAMAEGAPLASTDGCKIDWKAGNNLTLDSKSAKRPVGSFFCLFAPGTAHRAFGIGQAGRAAAVEVAAQEELLALDLQAQVVPHAATLYKELKDVVSDGDSDSDTAAEEQPGSDVDASHPSEPDEAGAARKAHHAAAAKHKHKGFKCNHVAVLLVLLGAVVLGQVFLFIDTLFAPQRKPQ